MAPRVAVIGGGVSGVGSALAVQQATPGVEVTLLAAELTPDTTGDGSAGMWGPRSVDGDPDQLNTWGRATHDFIHQLWLEGECPGIGILSAYDVADRLEEPYWAGQTFSCHEMSSRDLAEAGHAGKQGYRYVTLYAEPSKMLPFLMERFKSRGGIVLRSRVRKLAELVGYDVIVNCTGLDARELADDARVMPVRGQVVKVRAPAIKGGKFDFPGAYVIPNDDLIVLGGTAQSGDYCTTIDEGDTERILARCRQWIPSLRQAKVERVWAGLRPYREGGVRVEAERRQIGGRQVPVVHNYGHGGSGVTLFWGCALHVARLVNQHISGARNTSKL